MLPSLLHLIARHPQLLADHAEGYGELIAAEAELAAAAWKRRLLWGAIALASGGTALVLGGVAAMLWAVTPSASLHSPWMLIAVPLCPLTLALACAVAARGRREGQAFADLGRQIRADLALVREAMAR